MRDSGMHVTCIYADIRHSLLALLILALIINLTSEIMRIYDLSHNLDSDTQVYPGDPTFSCHKVSSIKNDGYSVTRLSLGSHTGTHIDAPSHFFENGKTVDELDLSLLVGSAVIIDIQAKQPRERIAWEDFTSANVDSLIQGHKILLVRTGWSKYWKTPAYLDHPFFDKEVATRLLELGIRVFGVDTLSPDETVSEGMEGTEDGDEDFGVHETLLGSGAMIVENLTNLDAVPGNLVQVSLLPLLITGEGSELHYARVFSIKLTW